MKVVIKMIKDLFVKYKEVILYLVFGVLTTIINLVIYFLLTKTFLNPDVAWMLQVANVISWLVSVIFAYVTNRKYVFNSHDSILKECFKFATARVLSLFFDMFIMFIGVSVLGYSDKIVKLVSQVVVILLNYIFSKLFVFKSKNDKI